MYEVLFRLSRSPEIRAMTEKDKKEGAKNPTVPGARIFRSENARPVYVNSTACRHWFYPLGEVNDLGMFCYMEKKAETDANRRWQTMAHPEVNAYYYILSGEGSIRFGGCGSGYVEECYKFGYLDLVVVPRGVPYTMDGEWQAVSFHVRTGIYGTVSGNSRYPHPVLYYDKPSRPTPEETAALAEPGELWLMDALHTRAIRKHMEIRSEELPDLTELRTDLEGKIVDIDYEDIYFETTPIDEQITSKRDLKEARKNPSVLGARVIRRDDSPAVYNSNAALRQTSYPLTWTDDIGICNLAEKSAVSDKDRPFDSHAHGDIEEYKFIISGSGTTTIGVGDETCVEERYDFKAGDLVALPRGLPHVEAGGFSAIFFHAKQSAFGMVAGNVLYPHIAYVYTKPPRPTPEEEAVLNDPGTYVMMNSRETYNLYRPNPILYVEKNRTEMTHLRPDLFPEAELQGEQE